MRSSGLWRLEFNGSGILAAGPNFWPRAVVWIIFLFGMTTLALFASFQLPDWLHLSRSYDYYCAVLIPAIAWIGYAIAVRFGERRSVSELSLRHAPMELLVGSIIGFGFISLVLFLLWALGLYTIALGHWGHTFRYFVFNAYVSALLEELAFRAILLRIFARMFGPLAGLIISAALFGLAHASHASLLAMVEIFVNGGVFLGLLYMVSGRLWLATGAHIGYDFTEWSIMGVGDKDGFLVVAPTPHYPAWLTGGEFGPDGSVLATIIGIVVGCAILLVRHEFNKRGESSPVKIPTN